MDIKIEEKDVGKKEEKKIVAVELPESLRQKIRKEAFEREISFSAMIRLILNLHFLMEEDDEE